MSFLEKSWPSILILVGAIIASVGTYVAAGKDSDQKDEIQRLSEQNKQISDTNLMISKQNQALIDSARKISKANLKLTTQVDETTNKINNLLSVTHALVDKIKSASDFDAARTLDTKELKLRFDVPYTDETRVTVMLGDNSYTNTITGWKAGAKIISIGECDPLVFTFNKDNHLLLNIKILDVLGNELGFVENNMWRVNRNIASRYNHDDNGFEVIDRFGNVAFSIDLSHNGIVAIKGIIPCLDEESVMVIGDNFFKPIVSVKNGNLAKQIKEAKILPIFNYIGDDWQGKRVKR